MTNAERDHKAKLVALGCLVCRRLYGEHEPAGVELHHYRSGGWGKGDYTTLIPLCEIHHRGNMGIHGMGTKAFDRAYSIAAGFTQADLLEEARRLTGIAGDFPASQRLNSHPQFEDKPPMGGA